MDISGLDKTAVLAALYNRAKPQGMGFLHYDPTPMTVEQAQQILGGGDDATVEFGDFVHDGNLLYFDYLKGRVMKVDLSGDEVDTWGYNRDNGENAAELVIVELRQFDEVNSEFTQERHRNTTLGAAGVAKASLGEETTLEENGDVGVMHLGLSDVAEHLDPAVDRVLKDKEHEEAS